MSENSIYTFRGSARQIGITYGRALRAHIIQNIKILISENEIVQKFRCNSTFLDWVKHPERLLEQKWLWLIEEFTAISSASGIFLTIACPQTETGFFVERGAGITSEDDHFNSYNL